jgi:hypothetical protein
MRASRPIRTVEHVDRAEALQALPMSYAIALRLRDEGVERDAVARVLDVEPEAVGPLLSRRAAGATCPARHERRDS